MQISPKYQRHFFGWCLFLLPSIICSIDAGTIEIANAQDIIKSEAPVSENTIAQAAPSQQTRPRLRTPFFEEERKLTFGFGDFLQSALDGANNFFAADSINNLSNLSNEAISNPTTQNLNGILTIQSLDKDDANFLTTTFVSNVPGVVNLTFTSPIYGSDPRIGTITVQNNQGTLNINNGSRNYSGSFSVKNEVVSGAIQVVDPRNPGTAILIQVAPVFSSGSGDDSKPISVPASFSIGLPTDR